MTALHERPSRPTITRTITTSTHTEAAAALLGVALALTGAFMLVEFAGGILARSLALMADAGHMLTDTAALALAWAATRIATRPADRRRSFGYQRLRVLATFVNGCALLFIVAWIAIEAVQRLLNPVPVNATAILWIGGTGLVREPDRLRDAATGRLARHEHLRGDVARVRRPARLGGRDPRRCSSSCSPAGCRSIRCCRCWCAC